MDLGLPDIDGFATTKKIRAINKEIPIIGLTAHAFEEDIKKCFAVKMNEVLTKPVSINDFKKVLMQFVTSTHK